MSIRHRTRLDPSVARLCPSAATGLARRCRWHIFGKVALAVAVLALTAVAVASALRPGTATRVPPPGRIAYVDGLSHALVTARPDGTDRVTVVPDVEPMGGPAELVSVRTADRVREPERPR